MNSTTKQRYISTSIWSDDWFDSLTAMEKLIYFNLLTNIHTNPAGVYPFALKYICADTGCSREEVNAAMKKFEKAGKAYFYREYMIIPKWLKHQKIKERSDNGKPSGLLLGAIKVLKALPDEIKDFIADRRHYDYDVSAYIGRFSTPSQDHLETIPPEKGRPSPCFGETISTPSQDHPPNSAHDLDLDLDLDLENNNNTAPPWYNPSTAPPPSKAKPKPKKPPLREREPENDMERVEKAYLLNWDNLFSQGKVKTANPIVNWTQTRALLKNHFKNLVPEQIISVVKNGVSDDFILQGGYSLATMLSSSVLNRLINSGQGQKKHRISNDNVDKDDISKYFTEV